MDTFEKRRQQLFQRIKTLLAEPVANLLATAIEPRSDHEAQDSEFDKLVNTKKNDIKDYLRNLTIKDGAEAESLGLDTIKALLVEAQKHDLNESVKLINSALTRRDAVGQNKDPDPFQPPDLERVPGKSGKPVGLWR